MLLFGLVWHTALPFREISPTSSPFWFGLLLYLVFLSEVLNEELGCGMPFPSLRPPCCSALTLLSHS